MNFKNKRITIMGIGMLGGGVGTTQFFSEHGARVLVTDLKSKDELKPSLDRLKDYPIEYVLGEHRDQDFIETDMVIRNPAVPEESKYLQVARDHNIPVEMAESMFLKLSPTKQIIGVTGTRGKSTTTAMIYHVLKKAGKDVYLAGNQKNTSTLLLLNTITQDSIVILELSSWQLESFAWHIISPHIAVITNIYPDHLNRYESMEQYIRAKSNIFLFQSADDHIVLNSENEQTRLFASEARGHVIWFTGKDWPESESLPIKGDHNKENALAARAVCRLFNISDKDIYQSLKTFHGLPGRLEEIKEVNGIRIINDTTSTTPVAGIKALESFQEKKIVLIIGGNSKDLSLEELIDTIKERVKALVYLKGDGTEIIKKELDTSDIPSAGPFESMKQTITAAHRFADQGDVILFSPSFTSFGQFKNEFERGEVFNVAAHNTITAHRKKTYTRHD